MNGAQCCKIRVVSTPGPALSRLIKAMKPFRLGGVFAGCGAEGRREGEEGRRGVYTSSGRRRSMGAD
ncbi:MAG: hypothetical protein AB1742_01110 [bacterium]